MIHRLEWLRWRFRRSGPKSAHGDGCRCHCEGGRQFTRCFGRKITIASQNSVECLTRIAPAADQDRSKRVHLEAELRYHSEIAAAPANAPELFRLNVRTGMQCATLGSDEVSAQQIVDRQAKAPAQPSHAAQREPRNSCVRNDSSRRYKSGSGTCHIQMPKQCTTLDFRGAGHGVNDDTVHCRQIEDDSAIAGRQAGEAMATAPDCQQSTVFSRKLHGPCNLGGRSRADNRGRAPIYRAVPYLTLYSGDEVL